MFTEGREIVCRVEQTVDDLVAEAKVELEAESPAGCGSGGLTGYYPGKPTGAHAEPSPSPSASPVKLVLERAEKERHARGRGRVMAPLARESACATRRRVSGSTKSVGIEAYFHDGGKRIEGLSGHFGGRNKQRTASVLVHHTENDRSPWQRAESRDCSVSPKKRRKCQDGSSNLRNAKPSQETST